MLSGDSLRKKAKGGKNITKMPMISSLTSEFIPVPKKHVDAYESVNIENPNK